MTGRKRHILVDAMGLLLAAVVTAAGVDDAQAAQEVFACAEPDGLPRMRQVWADNKYHNHSLYAWLEEHTNYRLEIVRRQQAGRFERLPRRWVVERTFAWLGRSRRLSKDYEHLTKTSKAMIKISVTHLMIRRLSRSNSTWRAKQQLKLAA